MGDRIAPAQDSTGWKVLRAPFCELRRAALLAVVVIAAAFCRPAPEPFATLQITTTTVPVATQYQSYSTQLTATGGVTPYTWSVSTSSNISLPEGMSINAATGVVSATQVNGQGGYAVTIQVTDSSTPSHVTVTATLNFGVNSDTSYAGCQMFPADSIFNQRADQLPVDTTTADQIPSAYLSLPIQADFGHGFKPGPQGLPWMRVPSNQPLLTVNLPNGGPIDGNGTYMWPFPAWPNAVIEGTSNGGSSDHHFLVLATSTTNITGPQTGPCTVYQTYTSTPVPSMFNSSSNTWSMSAGQHYVMNSNEIALSTSTLDQGGGDSAGIPILPLLMRYSEVLLGVNHPLRIKFPSPTNSWVWPATGCCTGSGPPEGLLYRLKASVNWQAVCPVSTNPQAATLLQGLQQYGAYMSDHNTAGLIGGTPDVRWNDTDLACIKNFPVSDLEVVNNSALEVSSISGQTKPYVVPATLAGSTTGASYSYTFSAVGGNPATLQWSQTSGTLPAGLVLNSTTGTISGITTSAVGSPFVFSMKATDTASGFSSAAQSFSIAVLAVPALTITKSHTGNFTQGQNGATYTLTVSNAAQAAATSGTVTVTETAPAGLTLVSMAGTSWACGSIVSNTQSCTRSDSLGPGGVYPNITVTVNVATTAPAQVTNSASVSGGGSTTSTASDLTTIVPLPVLSITKTHTGNFVQGQTGVIYTLTVSNSATAGPTSGTVTVTETVPTGLTLSSMSGTNWTCGGITCTRGDALIAGGIYPAITATVNVASNAPGSVINQATVTGGNSASATATDPTTISPPPVLSITKTHTGNFVQGQVGATYTVTVANGANAGATGGTVTVTETIPTGLTLASMSGTNWNCSGITCTRSDSLGAGGTYPAITVTVNVTGTAPASVTNQVSVSGGGSSPAAATNPTTIGPGVGVGTTSPLTAAFVNRTHSQTLTTSGGAAPYIWTIASGTQPPGLTLSAAGVLSGTPTAAGNYSFTIQVTDAHGATASASFVLGVTVLNYSVGDFLPATSDCAPNFGIGSVGVVDILNSLLAVNNLPGAVPSKNSDRYDAIDAYPPDTSTSRGGDGVLNNLDFVQIWSIADNNLTITPPVRSSLASPDSGCAAPAGSESAPMTASARQAPAQGSLVFGTAQISANGEERIPVYLQGGDEMPRMAMTFTVGGGQNQLRFVSMADAPPSVEAHRLGSVALAWQQGLSVSSGDRRLLGYLVGPAGMSRSLKVYGVSASGLDNHRGIQLATQGLPSRE